VAVIPKMSGTLQQVAVDIGDRVSAGQLVAVQDRRELDAQTDAAEAAVAVARAGLEQSDAALANAKLEFDRSTNLFQKGALAKQRLDASETALRSATAARSLSAATLQQVEASLRRAKEVRRDATLTAPTSGVVVERNFDQGALVGPGDSKGIVVVADIGEMKLEAGVSELEAGRLLVGMPAVVSVQARPGQSWLGRVVAVAPEVDGRNRHFRIEVRVRNPKGELLSGMYATARIETGRIAGATLIPRDAVATRNGTRVAYRVANGVVSAVPVHEGLGDDTHVAILSGLGAGDQIVADARKPMAPGTKVRAIPATAAATRPDPAQ
jgi:RND family efflux transporter MFP subunit